MLLNSFLGIEFSGCLLMIVVRKFWLYGLSIEAQVSGQSCILVFYIFGVNVLVHS